MPWITHRYPALTAFEIIPAVLISLVVQSMISLFAAAIPVLAPAIAAARGWNAAAIALYPLIIYTTAALLSFQIPGLLWRLGGMGLSLASVAVSASALAILLSPYAAAAALAAAAIGCATSAMNPASLAPRSSDPAPLREPRALSCRSNKQACRLAACWRARSCQAWCKAPAGALPLWSSPWQERRS